MSHKIIKKDCFRRIVQDVKEIILNPLDEQNIYYIHDQDHFLNGYAMIVGPEDTPYQYGYYFFHFLFPEDYPHSPPKVTYLTNDGYTRFHPNFYRSGKCCLSILNTWKGEEWSSCLTITSILLSLSMVLTNNPLTHEPGIQEKSKEVEIYNEIIEFQNFNHSIKFVIKNKPYYFFSGISNVTIDKEIFLKECKNHFDKNRDKILNYLENKLNILKYELSFNIYNMYSNIIDYPNLYKLIKKLK